MTSLWQSQFDQNTKKAQPLALAMRPRNFEEFVGQEHFLAPGKMLRRMLQADRLTSVIFYGPPGCGKTTLAQIIATTTTKNFERANAAAIGVKEVRVILDQAKKSLQRDGQKTIFFLDEIHRFNRAQQDILLEDVENGIITLIGATTENPFFSINSPLISRSQIFQFQPLNTEQIITVIQHAIQDKKRGLGKHQITLNPDAANFLAQISDGDARRALTALEIATLSSLKDLETPQKITIDLAIAQESIQQKALNYNPTGDQHYDVASAFIKSMRGSDPDAALYWLATMLHAGEDPRFIARRIAIFASEDIGNADPQALQVAASAFEITTRIGLPECQLTLSQAVIYMATASKSNAATTAIFAALEDVKQGKTLPVPKHLKDGHYPGAKKLGNAIDYQYPHDSKTGFVDQQYLTVNKKYYTPSERGYEKRIGQYLQWVENQRQNSQNNQH